ncbi:DUF4020 domain-containing protein [Chromatocurvus halotolerans]|uniref:SIR2-like protein n=1 Tax=Chromatocurvus halotolerans TaxID=1132028 RepID=A0A4R2KWU2_9GAMM|nr:DUF4020 domain-containing protein [Chromatocurvus halotolerans]TCO75749.1 SIR2-like protein [Chromatocurvus halotolerans]
MTILGAVEFDDKVFDALRYHRLVVFAGAGVSRAPPSSLPGFWELAERIANGTGLAPSEPLDRFLGQLDHKKVAVHARAAEILLQPESEPSPLHTDLVRLFGTSDRIKLVTTNFDLHFEAAAARLFSMEPRAFSAPALPRGSDFSGIVHIHGALPFSSELVLTDADFGRAYLTEGWARRFLVDLFRQYTVLFVGYRHDDVAMNYLARALPAEGVAGRFALTEELDKWDLLGITPIKFVKHAGAEPFRELYDAVHRLAERSSRGALDWESRLAELGSRAPPADPEAIGEIEEALRETHMTRFLLNAARDPEWLKWLNGRNYFDRLFQAADLGEHDHLFVEWIGRHFALAHPIDVFDILMTHGLRLNRMFWWRICRELSVKNDTPIDVSSIKRWITILLASAPDQADPHALMWLAERCASVNLHELTLKTFMAMAEHQLRVTPGFIWRDDQMKERPPPVHVECPLRSGHWPLNEVWVQHLEPYQAEIAEQLLSAIVRRSEEIYSELSAWGAASREWDPESARRSAIEAHEQDEYAEASDVLINAARSALESISKNFPNRLQSWMDWLVASDAPMLRRLAVHALTVDSTRNPEERLQWIIEKADLRGHPEHHEIHRAIANDYSIASDQAREAIVDEVMSYILPESQDPASEEQTDRWKFEWLSWLVEAKPDCHFASAALSPLQAKHPEWRSRDHLDFTHWTGGAEWVGMESPMSQEQLLAGQPTDQLDELLSFKGNGFGGPSRQGLLSSVREACKQRASWGFALAAALTDRSNWKSDLWPALIRGLEESDLEMDGWRDLLAFGATPALQSSYADELASMLFALVRDGGKPFAGDLLEEANAMALPLWRSLEPIEQEEVDNWLSIAINRPAGIIVEFLITGLSMLVDGKTKEDRSMPESYSRCFTQIVRDTTTNGGLGRSILASQTAFLFGLNQAWTLDHIIPLFSSSDAQRLAQAWDGFLVWGRLYPALVEVLTPAFVEAISRYALDKEESRRHFIGYYTNLAVIQVSDPTQQLLPELFRKGSLRDRIEFASNVGRFLRQMQEAQTRQLWDSWLRRYWQGRLQGVLAVLEDAEAKKMFEWVPSLGGAFPEAVALVIQHNPIRMEHSHAVFELRSSALVLDFPNETAELLIYLAGCVTGYQLRELAEIEARLPAIPDEQRERLKEAFALAGVERP